MKTHVSLCLILMLAQLTGTVRADGKFYATETVPVDVPYQRAIILCQGGQETLILQSNYRTPEGQPVPSLGWVIPTPAVPDLATIDADVAKSMFFDLDRASVPKRTVRHPWVARLVGMLLTALGAFVPALPGIGVLLWARKSFRLGQERLGCLLCILGGLLLLPALFMFSLVLTGGPRGLSGIEVVKAEQVGIYEAKVIRATEASELREWLNERQFHFKEVDAAAFGKYIQSGWCFVVARVNQRAGLSAGLVDPLILRFSTEKPVYPLALTATTGRSTEVLLYVLAGTKMDCGGRLGLRYADRSSRTVLVGAELYYNAKPKGFFPELLKDNLVSMPPWLCKFKGRLEPSAMAEDLVFSKAADQEPYREHIVTWW